MQRFACLSFALAVVGCAKSGAPQDKAASPVSPESSPKGGATAGEGAAADSPPHETASNGPGSPTDGTQQARDEARAQGMLGATDQRFDDSPLEGGSGTPKTSGAHVGTKAPVRGQGPTKTPDTATTLPPSEQTVSITAMIDTKQSDELTTLVKGRLADIGACRAKAPSVTGRLDVTFTIGDKGAIEKVTVASTSTLKDAAVSDCVAGVIKGITLAPATKAKRGSIKLTF